MMKKLGKKSKILIISSMIVITAGCSLFMLGGGKITINSVLAKPDYAYLLKEIKNYLMGTKVETSTQKFPEKYNLGVINNNTVTFNSNGGSEVASETVNHGSTVTEPVDPTKEGYTFSGWYSDEELSEVFNFETIITDDMTLYAKWNINEYTVTFKNTEEHGGSTIYEQIVERQNFAQRPQNPELENYIFGSWYTDENFEHEYNFYQEVTKNIVLYAKWNTDKYTVTFDTKGGNFINSIETLSGGTVEEPTDPTKEGYTFGGWYTDEEYESQYDFNTEITSNVILYAKWNINEYTVTFETNGGTHIDEIEVNHGLTVTKPTDPTKEGYTFDGWYLDETLNTLFDFETIITENITLYAKWNINEYTVTFNSNGGSEVASIAVNHGLAVTKPTDPTKEGYTFGGWYTDEECINIFDFSTSITENITLYAKWIIIIDQYALIFDTNEGSLINSIIVDAGDAAIIPSNPTKSGYNFIEWNTKTDGSGTSYHSGEQITIDSDTILYAIWVEDYDYIVNKYQISSDSKYIDYIPYGTSLGTFRSNIILNDNYTMSVDTVNIKGNEVLYTSGKTRIYRNSRLYNEYTNVVRGDVNGDGKIGIVDYLRIRKDIMSTTANGPDKLKNEFKLAADMNEDNKVGIIDYLRIRKIIMEEQ